MGGVGRAVLTHLCCVGEQWDPLCWCKLSHTICHQVQKAGRVIVCATCKKIKNKKNTRKQKWLQWWGLVDPREPSVPKSPFTCALESKGQLHHSSNCPLWHQVKVLPAAKFNLVFLLSETASGNLRKFGRLEVSSRWERAFACSNLLQQAGYQVHLTCCEHKLIRLLILFSDFRGEKKINILPCGKEIRVTWSCSADTRCSRDDLKGCCISLTALLDYRAQAYQANSWPKLSLLVGSSSNSRTVLCVFRDSKGLYWGLFKSPLQLCFGEVQQISASSDSVFSHLRSRDGARERGSIMNDSSLIILCSVCFGVPT